MHLFCQQSINPDSGYSTSQQKIKKIIIQPNHYLFADVKKAHYIILLVPIIFTVLAIMRFGFFFRAGVSASCVFILLWMPDKFAENSLRMVIAALIISIGGDWFMSHVGDIPARFIYGICLFFVAHICFLGFCLKNGRINFWILLAILIPYLIFFFIVLSPTLTYTILYVAVLLYLLVSCFSLAAAAGLRLPSMTRWYFITGIGLLVFSDTMISLKVFTGCDHVGFLILPTYFASQIFITLSLMRRTTT